MEAPSRTPREEFKRYPRPSNVDSEIIPIESVRHDLDDSRSLDFERLTLDNPSY